MQGSALIIGGLAVIHHGYRRLTEFIDLLYAQSDGTILKRLKPHFKTIVKAKSGWHHLQHRKTGVRLELIPEGGMTNYAFIPGPATVGGEDGYISLFGLVWLKLAAGRAKDDADLVELMKIRMADAKAILPKLHPDLRKRYAGFLSRARKELENDPSQRP